MYPVRLDRYEMRRLLLFLIFLSNVSVASSAADGRLLCDTITSGGIVREFKLYMPDGIRQQAPLVIVLHGYGGSADPGRFGMNSVADRYGVAVCYPEGVRDVRGKRCWNVGRHVRRQYGVSVRSGGGAAKPLCSEPSGYVCYGIVQRRRDVLSAGIFAPRCLSCRGACGRSYARMVLPRVVGNTAGASDGDTQWGIGLRPTGARTPKSIRCLRVLADSLRASGISAAGTRPRCGFTVSRAAVIRGASMISILRRPYGSFSHASWARIRRTKNNLLSLPSIKRFDV